MTTPLFERAFEIILGHEGGYQADPRDRGNWTGGKVGVGKLKGTKYGISAMAYPTLDIANLTVSQAKAIYYRDYWSAIGADHLPAPLGLVAFDTAVNSGVGRAKQFLTQAKTAEQFLNVRLAYLKSLTNLWPTYGNGWARRVATLRQQAARFA